MKRTLTPFLALALVVACAASAMASNAVRISQVYGGGGGSTGVYLYDYVELFNNSGVAVNIGGWSLQYGSATGTSFGGSAGNIANIPAGVVIQPCRYYLVQVGSAGTAGVDLPVTPDLVTAGPNISQTTGKIALINNQTGNNLCNGNTSGAIYVDVVGWGPTANCFETSPAPVASSTLTEVRKTDGAQDTDNNSSDFLATATATVTVHNSQSPPNLACVSVPTMPATWGRVKMLYR
jgi:hypothetical protein